MELELGKKYVTRDGKNIYEIVGSGSFEYVVRKDEAIQVRLVKNVRNKETTYRQLDGLARFDGRKSPHDLVSEYVGLPEGFTPHTPGDPYPGHPEDRVAVVFKNGDEGPECRSAQGWYWGEDRETTIIGYKVVKPYVEPDPYQHLKDALAAGKMLQVSNHNGERWLSPVGKEGPWSFDLPLSQYRIYDPATHSVPNETTQKAMQEVAEGEGKRFDSVDEQMEDLTKEDAPKTLLDEIAIKAMTAIVLKRPVFALSEKDVETNSRLTAVGAYEYAAAMMEVRKKYL